MVQFRQVMKRNLDKIWEAFQQIVGCMLLTLVPRLDSGNQVLAHVCHEAAGVEHTGRKGDGRRAVSQVPYGLGIPPD